ncbi:MAG: ABC transporter permease [Clostridia bacterium]|nr:ABC transporter permease [Clostridia bacterium]
MKNFFILFKLNIKDLWENNRFIFILVLCFMFLSFTFIEVGYNVINYVLFEVDGNYLNDTFTFKLNSRENLQENLDKYLNETEYIPCVFFSFECPNLIEENTATIYALYSGNFREDTNISLGNWFSSSQMEKGDKVIVVPYYTFFKRTSHGEPVTKYELGTEFDINGETYTVIGESSIIRYIFFVPYNSIQDKDTFVNIHITVRNKYMESKNIKFAENVMNCFDCEVIEAPEPRNMEAERLFKILYTLIFSIGITNLVFVYGYLLDQRKKLIGLFKVYGMNKKKCILYLLFEFMLWLLFCYILSCLVVALFLLIAVKMFFVQSLYIFELWEYLSFLVIYLVLYIIVFLPTIIKCINRNNELDLINNGKGD